MQYGVWTWPCFAYLFTTLRSLPWMTGTPSISIRPIYSTHASDSSLCSTTLTMGPASTYGKLLCHWDPGNISNWLSKLRAVGCPRWQDSDWTTQSEGNHFRGMICQDNLLPSLYLPHQAMKTRLKIHFQIMKILPHKSLNKMRIPVILSGNRMMRGKETTQRTLNLLYCECIWLQ